MAVVVALLQIVLPVLLKSAGDGTLIEIVDTASKLLRLLIPLVGDPKSVAALEALAASVATLAPRPGQPEDPAMARAAPAHKFGGR